MNPLQKDNVMRTSNTGIRNLYQNSNGYFVYKRPDNGKRFGMGKDRYEAIAAAKELNEKLIVSSSLVGKVLDKKTQVTFNQHCDYVVEQIWKPRTNPGSDNPMSVSTLTGYLARLKTLREEFGDLLVSDDHFDVLRISPFLDGTDGHRKQTPRMKNSYRTILSILFNEAKDRGLMTSNPATDKKKAVVGVERRRLSLELFLAIREEVKPWVRPAMDMALYLGARVSDVSELRWKDNVEVINGVTYLVYKPKKGRNKKKSEPIRARCEGPVLEILKKCRDDVISEYIFHFPVRGRSFRKFIGKPLDSGYLSHQFSDARGAVFEKRPELFTTENEQQYGKMRPMKPSEFPTWHEIRSLAGWLEEQVKQDGGESARKMFAHEHMNMTELYFSRRPVEVTEITIGSTSYT
jgi:integrase